MLPSFTTRKEGSALAGVCSGIAAALDVDVTLVRLIFALLALAGGAGVVLYLALWAWAAAGRAGGGGLLGLGAGAAAGRPWWAVLLVLVAASLLLQAVGLSGRGVIGIVLVGAGVALALRDAGSFRADAPLSYGGLLLAGVGGLLLLREASAPTQVLAPGAIAGGLLLVAGPWLGRPAAERRAAGSA